MEAINLIEKFHRAFGCGVPLPVAIRYTDQPVRLPDERIHCMMRYLVKAKEGVPTSLAIDNIFCRGGKVYSGFGEMNEGICKFVSNVEKYKDSPDSVARFVDSLGIKRSIKPYLTFQRVDSLESLDDIVGIVVFATPDILAGLWSWANFDVEADDAVIANFGSGCSSTISNMMRENRMGGYRCFISMLDISVRLLMNPGEVCFSIPRVRLERMFDTFDRCCLSGAPAWEKVKKRIEDNCSQM